MQQALKIVEPIQFLAELGKMCPKIYGDPDCGTCEYIKGCDSGTLEF